MSRDVGRIVGLELFFLLFRESFFPFFLSFFVASLEDNNDPKIIEAE